MADQSDVKRLEMRITELENQLKRFQAVQDISGEEAKAYLKVGSALSAFDDWGCGINECRPIVICRICRVCKVCSVCRVCRPCIVECSCGPCAISGLGMGGGGFSGFGD